MRVSYSTFLVGALAANQVSATWDLFAKSYSSPKNYNNKCEGKQSSGFDWDSLTTGSSFSSYGGFSFSGFTCSSKFGKRDDVTKRSFQSKCITGTISKDQGSSPSLSCSDRGFSVNEFQITVDEEIDVEFHYTMEDSSICKQTASCSKSGTTVKNTQCGGAKSVTFKIPDSGSKSSCGIGIHHIDFDCGSYSSSSAHSSTPSATPYESSSVVTPTPTPSSSPVESTPVESTPTPYETSPAESTPVESTPTPYQSSQVESSPVESTPTPYETSPAESTPAVPTYTAVESSPVPVESTPVPSSPAESTPEGTPTPYQSSPVESSPAVPTYTAVETPSGSIPTYTAVETPSGSIPTYTAANTPSAVTSDVCAMPTSSIPDVIPRCFNTWMLPECKSNADYSCYCKDADFALKIYECVSAWESDSTLISQALSYFVGLCASYVPQNPGLVTNCPGSVTLGGNLPSYTPPAGCASTPVAVPSSAASYEASTITPAPSAPAAYSSYSPAESSVVVSSSVYVTTISVSQTVTVPCVVSTGVSAGYTVPGSSVVSTYITTVTVPQVVFSTQTVTASGSTVQSVNVVPGTPAPVPAATTANGYGSAASSFGTVTLPTGSATSSLPASFSGSAVKVGSGSFAGAAVAAVMVAFAL